MEEKVMERIMARLGELEVSLVRQTLETEKASSEAVYWYREYRRLRGDAKEESHAQ